MWKIDMSFLTKKPGRSHKYKKQLSGDGSCTEFDECALGVSNCNLTTSICVNTFGSHVCLCKSGYIADVDGNCVDIDECFAGLCPESSEGCENTIGGYSCTCPEGFIGTMSLDIVALDTINDEVIFSESLSFDCGDRDNCAEMIGEGCPSNSECTNIIGGVSCLCGPGFEDANAGNDSLALNCVDIDECLGKNRNSFENIVIIFFK